MRTLHSHPATLAAPAARRHAMAAWRQPALGLACVLAPGASQAHVKWFSIEADCRVPPLPALHVLAGTEFFALGVASLLVLAMAAQLEPRARPWVPALPPHLASAVPHALRLSLAGFFAIVAFYFQPSVYLTPELRAAGGWVAPLQAAIAASLLGRRTAWLGALGMAALYGAAALDYGWFHLLDYPVFLAAALAVALDACRPGRHHRLALGLLRLGAGVTLMWAGAEKWLYPWWSHPMLDHELAALRGSLSSQFIMASAGWVEFCAAYALIFGRVGTQVAAWVLLLPFVAAIPVFGVVDAIGHAPIIVVLLILGVTRTTLPARWQHVGTADFALGAVLGAIALVGGYWLLQRLAHPRAAETAPHDVAAAVLMLLPLLAFVRARTAPACRARPHAHARPPATPLEPRP